MHGHGVSTNVKGSKYDGMWFNGEMHGEGELTLADGQVKVGSWLNGKYQSN